MPQKQLRHPSGSPFVSVIVPVFNGERTIAACLDSITEQSLEDIEVIVVDDASTDGTREIVTEYAARDARIKRIGNTTNLDSYAARIRGFNQAAGRYIAACDCDDRMSRDALKLLYDTAEQTGADIVHGRTQELHGKDAGKMLPVYEPFAVKTGEAFALAMLRNFRGWNLWGKLFRRTVWCGAARFLPDAHWHTADDLLTCFAMGLEAKRYQGISDPVYLYSQPEVHVFSSREGALKSATDHLEVLGALFSIAEQRRLAGKFPELLDRLTRHILLSMARNLHDDIAVRSAVALKIESTIGADFARWAVEHGMLGDDAGSRRMRSGTIARLMPWPGKFLRHIFESGSHECWVTLRRAYGAAQKRGWRAVMREMSEL